MCRKRVSAFIGLLVFLCSRAVVNAGVPKEKIAEYVQRQVVPFMDEWIDGANPAADARIEKHKRMVLNVKRYTAALDGLADAEVDQDVAAWIEHSMMAQAIHDGGELWSPDAADLIGSIAKGIGSRLRGLTNARCRQRMDERNELIRSAALYRQSLANYVVARMSAMPVIRVMLGGCVSEFKNAILQARGERDRMFLDPGKLEGTSRVILDCRDNPVDSRIMTLAVVRECCKQLARNDQTDWNLWYSITSPAFDTQNEKVVRHPLTFQDVLPQVEELWCSIAHRDEDGEWTVNAAAWNSFLWRATSLRFPSLHRSSSLPAQNDHPIFAVFRNDPESWQLLPSVPSAFDSDGASGGGVTDGPGGPVVTLPPARSEVAGSLSGGLSPPSSGGPPPHVFMPPPRVLPSTRGQKSPSTGTGGSGDPAPLPVARSLPGPSGPTDIRINPKDSAEMVYVPAGEFLMGSTEAEIAAVFRGASGHVAGVTKEGLACETPQRKVYLDGYWIYKNDVTVGEYRNFCLATGREMPDAPAWGWKDDHPMVNVTWNDAKAYCDWAGAALPTEAQWEKAARGGDVRNYPWGFTWDAGKLWCSVGEKRMSTAAVGRYPAGASPYGCLDMVGNVNQWCADWYDDSYYRKGENHNPPGAETGQMRVLRGGSWNKDATFYLRCAIRSAGIPNFRYLSYFGFRCVVPVGSP